MSGKLSREEKELLQSYERGEWESIRTSESIERHREAARRTFAKDKRVNIRISGKDLDLIQERALIEGIPYQTLMSSVLHKYVTGRLVDRSAPPEQNHSDQNQP